MFSFPSSLYLCEYDNKVSINLNKQFCLYFHLTVLTKKTIELKNL